MKRLAAWLVLIVAGSLVGLGARWSDTAFAASRTIAALEAQVSETDRPVTIWHIPHPDDETLGMAGGIMEAAAMGERNVVVLYTQGGNSDVRFVLNGLFYCWLHERYHDPIAEGYDPLDVEAFKKARVAETIAALALLGVDEDDVIVFDFPDGALQVGDALEAMVELDRLFPGARHRTTSVLDRHRDHKTLARALNRLKDLKQVEGIELDLAYYRVYHYGRDPEVRGAASGVQTTAVADLEQKQKALAEFALWAPEKGRYAIGMHSVPGLFAAASDDPNEYLDDPDSLPLPGLTSAGRLSVSLFLDETALSYRLVPGWKLRVGAPYTVDALRSTLVYERRSPSAAVMLYAGLGAEVTGEGLAPYSLAGMRIVDQFIVEYRPADPRLGRGSAFQFGWNLDI